MGITIDKYFENLYSVVFSPKAFFEREDLIYSVRLAFTNILLISLISKLASAIADKTITNPTFAITIWFSILGYIIIWLLNSLFFQYVAKIFDREADFSKLLFFTSFVPVPYIFFAPLNLVKTVGIIGYVLGALGEFFLYIWIIFLFMQAIRAVYKITLARSFMLILLPMISSFFAINWGISFFSQLWYIFSI